MSSAKSTTACSLALLWLCLTLHVQALASTSFVDDDTKIELSENVDDMNDVTTSDADDGEASYNVEDCQALLNEAEGGGDTKPKDGGSGTAGGNVEKLDLDKCRSMKK